MEKNRALIVIDVQNDFLPGGALAVLNGEEVLPVINRLLKFPFEHIIAWNAENVATNWAGGIVGATGSAAMYSGHNDNNPSQASVASANDSQSCVGTDGPASCGGTGSATSQKSGSRRGKRIGALPVNHRRRRERCGRAVSGGPRQLWF